LGSFLEDPVVCHELDAWEETHLDGVVGTSDWPGWLPLIGPRPFSGDLPPRPPKKPTPPPRRPMPRLRDRVWERDQGRCRDCGSTEDMTFDHIIPVFLGGLTEEVNLCLRCRSCNSRKGAR
jgi:5-methylcytosine-specific restriction endonuclease McrA